MSLQNIYKAIGSLAYTVAKADGIEKEEKEVIRKLAQEELQLSELDNEWINNMFIELEEKNISMEEAYRYALDVLESNRFAYDFDDVMKKKCKRFMERTAEAFGGVSSDERRILEQFQADLSRF